MLTMEQVHAHASRREQSARMAENVTSIRYWRAVRIRAEIALALAHIDAL